MLHNPRPEDIVSVLLRVLRALITICLQGDWLCPSCKAGEPPPLQQTQAVTLRQKLLSRAAGLAVLRIESLHRQLESSGHQKGRKRGDPECEFTFTGRWYCLPEETRHGRQARTGWPLVRAHACNTSITATDELSIAQLFGAMCVEYKCTR